MPVWVIYMTFYDKDGKEYNFNHCGFINEGTTGRVYRINDTECLKRIYCGCFQEDMFNLLSSIYLNGFVKLGIPFYVNNFIKAYTMEYFKKSSESILDKPIDYTIDNFEIIFNDVVKLSSCGIKLYDLCWKNIIVGDSKVKVIDFDYYDKTLEEDVYYFNVANLVSAFKLLYLNEIRLDNSINVPNMNILKDYLKTLFNVDYNNPVLTLRKTLGSVKRPKDLFLK